MVPGFTKKYKIKDLIYYQETKYVNNAIQREKQLKGWTRKKKINLIESQNPKWNDLFYEIGGKDEMLQDNFLEGYH